jgi:hypothetical protein
LLQFEAIGGEFVKLAMDCGIFDTGLTQPGVQIALASQEFVEALLKRLEFARHFNSFFGERGLLKLMFAFYLAERFLAGGQVGCIDF